MSIKIEQPQSPTLYTNRYKDYWGYEVKMLEELSRRLHFTYKIVNPPDAGWGMINETGQWTGLTGMASRGDADVPGIEVIGVISDILPNFARFQEVNHIKFRFSASVK